MPKVESIDILNDGYITVRGDGLPARLKVIGSLDYAPIFTTGLTVTGGTTGIAISGTTTGLSSTDPIAVTLTGETSSHIGLTATIAASAQYTGWALGVFGTTTLSGTLGNIGQAAGGIFELNLAAGFAGATSGLLVGAMIGAYANATSGEKPTAVLWVESIAGATVSLKADGTQFDQPLLALVTSGGGGGGGAPASLAIEFGSEIAGKTVGTGSGEMFYAQNIQVKVNGTLYYMPLSNTEGMFKYADKAEFNKTFATFGTYNDLFGMNLTMDVALTTGKYLDILYIGHYGTGNIDSGAQYYPLWVDISGSGTNNSGKFYMAKFSRQAGAPIPDCYIQFQSASPGIEHLFILTGDVAPWAAGGSDCQASSTTDPRGTIAIREPDGTTVYIRCWDAK